jgi:anti-sigma regulatory factor (Ser/Thr protein kinase)
MTGGSGRFRRTASGRTVTDDPSTTGGARRDVRGDAAVSGEARRAARERGAPAVASEIAGLRRWLGRRAELAAVPEATRADVVLAASEALSNAVMHAFPEEPGTMRIAVTAPAGWLVVEVSDDGVGIRPRVGSAGAGLGLAVIASLATELVLGQGADGRGTRVVMRFALS